LGVLVWYQYSFSYGWGKEALWKIKDNFLLFQWDPYYSPAMQSIKLLSSNYLATLQYTDDYHVIGLAPCQFDIYLYCTFGLLPVILLGGVISALFFFIIKNISLIDSTTKNTNIS